MARAMEVRLFGRQLYPVHSVTIIPMHPHPPLIMCAFLQNPCLCLHVSGHSCPSEIRCLTSLYRLIHSRVFWPTSTKYPCCR